MRFKAKEELALEAQRIEKENKIYGKGRYIRFFPLGKIRGMVISPGPGQSDCVCLEF